jgi:hypothetical protein
LKIFSKTTGLEKDTPSPLSGGRVGPQQGKTICVWGKIFQNFSSQDSQSDKISNLQHSFIREIKVFI